MMGLNVASVLPLFLRYCFGAAEHSRDPPYDLSRVTVYPLRQ